MTTTTEVVPNYLDVTRVAIASFLARYRQSTLTAYTQDLKAYLCWCQDHDRADGHAHFVTAADPQEFGRLIASGQGHSEGIAFYGPTS